MTHHAIHRDSQMQACIDACTECHAVCLETMNYCLSQGGQHAAPEHIALLSACADICATSADAMLTGASVSPVICGTCAEVCRKCAQSCERMGDDAQMKHCAEVCMRCAESCATMVA
ncbi:ferredoxin [Lysobacter arseniciresistens ZS79]|uniref:Ferredoxin n=1 Tax=Lysobacter arseniciresistens ZS79 TaxID=913325 RepID=A0A0A0F3G4_9GAMM|nr:four-helix bundle copper-binding protein [Lysobacter arseniciresistens]KGM55937.1 ferredoxin [Lysobacter arseniciresistens ZS79]